jgi:holo-[acyl-carrier protein] synthase
MRTGVDLIEIPRIQSVLERHGQRFLQRVFTAQEIAAYGSRPASLAARWAGKEAVAKTLGSGIGAVRWRDIEILSDADGAPRLLLHGQAAARSAELGLSAWSISLSHTHTLAIAFVVAHETQTPLFTAR